MRRIYLALVAAAMLVCTAGSLPAIQQRAIAQPGTQFGAQRFPALDVDHKDTLYLMMSVATAADRPHSQIFLTVSKDRGASWNNFPQTKNLSKSPGEAFGPSVAVTKTGMVRVYVTYHDNSNGTTQAYLIRSKKKTKFKFKPLNITPHGGGAFSPRIALDSTEGANIVWGDLENGARVAFVRSTDQGATYTEPLYVSRDSSQSSEPELAVDSGDAINVVWQQKDSGQSVIMFARSTDGGATFSPPRQISIGTGNATEPQITAGSGRLHVVWVDESTGSAQAYYSRSTNAGESFSEPINVSNKENADIHKPASVVFQDTVYVAYQDGDLFGDDRGRNRQVFLTRSTDAGLTFESPVRVSNANPQCGRAHSPAMVVDSRGMLHIAWIDASLVQGCADEGVLFYSNTTNGRNLSPQRLILAVI